MSKFKLQVAPGQNLELSLGWWNRLRQGDVGVFPGLASKLSAITFILWLMSIPVLALVTPAGFELALLTSTLISLTVLAVLLVITIIFTRSAYLTDPIGLMEVLIFALISITAFLFVPANRANTFGSIESRYLSGIVVMSGLAIYFLVNVFLYTKVRQNLVWRALRFILLMLPIVWMVMPDKRAMMSLAVLLIPVYIYNGINSNRLLLRVMDWVAIVIASIMLFAQRFISWKEAVFLAAMLLLIAARQLWSQYKLSDGLPNPTKLVAKFANGNLAFFDLWRKLGVYIWVLMGIVYAIAAIVVVTTNFGAVSADVSNFIAELQSLFTSLASEPLSLIIGQGVGGKTYETGMLQLIAYQGLAGLIAYLVLLIGAGGIGLRLLRSAQRARFAPWLWYLASLPLLALFSQLSLFSVLVWWLVLSLGSAHIHLSYYPQIYKLWSGWQVNQWNLSKLLTFIQIVLMLLVIAGGVYLVINIYNLLY